MNTRPLQEARNPDLRGSLAALRRAAKRAREIAAQTGTAVVVSRNGVIEHLRPPVAGGSLQANEPPPAYGDDA
ncbi:MAG: hypothetical protein ABI478_06680 [Propionivibrio sp.]